MSRHIAIALFAISCAFGFNTQVSANFVLSIWTEHNQGDANYHNLPGNAVVVSGVGPLLQISGRISGTSTLPDFDVYRIKIEFPNLFSASTVAHVGGLGDTALFLFSTSGVGIAMNEDVDDIVFRSVLPVGDNLYKNLAPGEYLLAIGGFDHDPVNGSSEIFPDILTGVVAANPGIGPMTGQVGTSQTGTYTIQLTGAAAIEVTPAITAVPEPSSLILLGISAAVGAFYHVRRRLLLGAISWHGGLTSAARLLN